MLESLSSGTVTLKGPNKPSLSLARKIFLGKATAKEREDYLINYASQGELTLGKPFGEMSYDEFQKATTINENLKYGDLTGGNCPLCRNKGLIYGLTLNGVETVKECECMDKRRAREKLELSEYSTYLTSKTFENFETKTEMQKKAKKKAKDFLKQSRFSLFFVGGSTGTGKTHLTVALFYQLVLLGYSGEFVRWQEEIECLKSEQFDDTTNFKRRMKKLKYTSLLLIDDFLHQSDGEKPSNRDLKFAKEIIDERMIRGLKTLISSNFTLETIYRNYQELGGRLNEYSGGYSNFSIDLKGENYRRKEVGQMELVEDVDF